MKNGNFAHLNLNMGNRNWYAVYTRPRFEKKIEKFLQEKNIQCYLPMVKTLRQWSDRRKWVDMPLFNSYIFVYAELAQDKYEILSIPGVVRFISFDGSPVEIPAQQIEKIQWVLSTDIVSEPLNEMIAPGSRVEIIKGPLRGMRAEMVHYNNKKKIIIRIDQLERSLEIQIPENHVAPLNA